MNEAIRRDPLNWQAESLTEAETLIKRAVTDAVFRGTTFQVLNARIQKIIEAAEKRLTSPALKEAARRSLNVFATRIYHDLRNQIGTDWAFVAAVLLLANGKTIGSRRAERVILTRRPEVLYSSPDTDMKGIPMQRYAKDYAEKVVKPALDRLAEAKALDPDDYSGRNSLRNLAEMQVRYEGHLEEIAELKAGGQKLVVCSVHADCSDRCATWQGRVYSLDGTSGRTDDGREFIPLETATDIYYTTKAGKTYKNGLLGFNCFDNQTEVYTDKGWKLFAELKGDERFYTLHPQTREAEWQKAVNHFCKPYSGEMVYLHNEGTSLVVTPDHDLLYYTQKDRSLRFKPAKDFSTATFLTAGQEWDNPDIPAVILGGKEVPGNLYCKFMAYYLADGSKHSEHAVKIAQTDNEGMFEELKALPFKVWHDDKKIVIYGKELVQELFSYGDCSHKYVPDVIKQMSRRQIRLFLDGYLLTDGFRSTPKPINNRMRRSHLSVFTTSKRMAEDLGELAMKAGYRPKFDLRMPNGKEIRFRNGTYKSKLPLYVVHLNYRVNVTHLQMDRVSYAGKVYCVEVPNHTLLVRRKGRVVWCGNCRHKLFPYHSGTKIPTVSAAVQKREYEITKRQRAYERAIREAKDKAAVFRESFPKEAGKWRARAAELNKEYIEFSLKHDRAYYPSRTKIL